MQTLDNPTQASSLMSLMHQMQPKMQKMMELTKEERIQRPPEQRKILTPDEADLMLRQAAQKHADGMSWCDAAIGTGFTSDSIRRRCIHKGYSKKNESRQSRDQDNVDDKLCLKVERMRSKGMFLIEALNKAGLKQGAYYNALGRLGISKKVHNGRGSAR